MHILTKTHFIHTKNYRRLNMLHNLCSVFISSHKISYKYIFRFILYFMWKWKLNQENMALKIFKETVDPTRIISFLPLARRRSLHSYFFSILRPIIISLYLSSSTLYATTLFPQSINQIQSKIQKHKTLDLGYYGFSIRIWRAFWSTWSAKS